MKIRNLEIGSLYCKQVNDLKGNGDHRVVSLSITFRPLYMTLGNIMGSIIVAWRKFPSKMLILKIQSSSFSTLTQ